MAGAPPTRRRHPWIAKCVPRPTHVARKSRFSDELEDYMSEDDAEHTLRAMISLGRYAEAFAYDDENASFSLENPT